MPGFSVVSDLPAYDDEFLAYLVFQYLKSSPPFSGAELLLTFAETPAGPRYTIHPHIADDLLASQAALFAVEANGLTSAPSYRFIDAATLKAMRHETRQLTFAYSLPARRKLETLSGRTLIPLVERFIRFKSATDARVLRHSASAPHVLTPPRARRLAEDIVAVAAFYSLPLDLFLGIGAMENNYMDTHGDLDHVIWKTRPEPGDIVVKRVRGKVLVLNFSSGVWQITRQTLRYAHRLFLKDGRDYSRLPARLRPPRLFDVNRVAPETLTTYAGLVFRDLLDRCGGNTIAATGAYNGGFERPNIRYADGVQKVADYARHTIEHAAVLPFPAARTAFLTAAR